MEREEKKGDSMEKGHMGPSNHTPWCLIYNDWHFHKKLIYLYIYYATQKLYACEPLGLNMHILKSLINSIALY